MGKIKNFLGTKTEITHGQRIQTLVGVIILTTMAEVLNYKLFKSRMDNLNKDLKIICLETKAGILEQELESLKEVEILDEQIFD